MKTMFKTVIAAGFAAAFVTLSGREAEAKPMFSSWYGPGFEGNHTASGEIFRADAHTAAHPSLPFGTQVLITYGVRQVVVRVNDRGPFVGGRQLDLSRAAAERIGLTAAGADVVDARILMDHDGNDSDGSRRASRKNRDECATLLFERPYLKVLNVQHSARVCNRAWGWEK